MNMVQVASAKQPVPAGAIGIALDAQGHSTRYLAGQRMPLPDQGKVFWVYPGPFRCSVQLHPATPEIGLALSFVLDAPDPRVREQRFDLFLASEVEGTLTVAQLAQRWQAQLQHEWASGGIDCGPCLVIREWMRLRGQLERWLYTRYGLTIEDCALVDLGAEVDYAALLLQRAAQQGESVQGGALEQGSFATAGAAATVAGQPARAPASERGDTLAPASPAAPVSPASSIIPSDTTATKTAKAAKTTATATATTKPPAMPRQTAPLPASPEAADAHILRRLFLELPAFGARWRMLNPPSGAFSLQQDSLQRLSLWQSRVGTMPALLWASPTERLSAAQVARRAEHSRYALAAWEQAWALLARLDQDAANWAQEADAMDRIWANLDDALASRAAVPQPEECA